ncbi:MAG: T9SS type A sorting domain-containing protein [Bacteroidia bacterium]|nr:T9SS type A sorting domain-containing protein [Bacteroidia bacterium]
MKKPLLTLILLIIGFASLRATKVETVCDGDWTNNLIWSTGSLPLGTDTVIISNHVSCPSNLTTSSKFFWVKTGGEFCGTIDFTVNAGAYVLVDGVFKANQIFLNSNMVVNGSLETLYFVVSGYLTVNGQMAVGGPIVCSPVSSPCLAPVADFSLSATQICERGCVSFQNLSTNNPSTYSWSFPFGNPSTSNLANPGPVCYDYFGLNSVTLIVSNNFGSDTITKTDCIEVMPGAAKPGISAISPTHFCNGQHTTLHGISTETSWEWNSGPTTQDINVTTSGFYNVRVYNFLNCPSPWSDTVPVEVIIPPTPVIIPLGADSLMAAQPAAGYLWYLNGALLPDITRKIKATQYGAYTLQTKLEFCWSDTSLPYLLTGLSQTDLSERIRVYPNPFGEFLEVQNPGNEPLLGKLSITDLAGRLVYLQDLNIHSKIRIQLSHLAPGLYQLCFSDNQGQIFTQKVVRGQVGF